MITSVDLEKYVTVVDAKVVGPSTLQLTFDDGFERVIDFRDVLVGPVFEPLHDPAVFQTVKVNPDTGTIEWPTGADFSPVVLYDWPRFEAKLKNQRQRQPVTA